MRLGDKGLAIRPAKRSPRFVPQAFFSLELPSGMILNDCLLHEKNGSRWVNLPPREYAKPDGERSWLPLVEFASKDARERFRAAALTAVDNYLREAR